MFSLLKIPSLVVLVALIVASMIDEVDACSLGSATISVPPNNASNIPINSNVYVHNVGGAGTVPAFVRTATTSTETSATFVAPRMVVVELPALVSGETVYVRIGSEISPQAEINFVAGCLPMMKRLSFLTS